MVDKIVDKIVSWLVTLLAVTAAWWALFGWDVDDAGYLGPYEAWQVVLYVVVLLAVTGWLGLRGTPYVGAVVLAVAAAVNWSISAVTSTVDGASLWPIGAAMVLVGSFAGSLVVAVAVDYHAPRFGR